MFSSSILLPISLLKSICSIFDLEKRKISIDKKKKKYLNDLVACYKLILLYFSVENGHNGNCLGVEARKDPTKEKMSFSYSLHGMLKIIHLQLP